MPKPRTPEQRAARQRRRFRHDLADISQPLSGGAMTRVARQLTDRQYQPQLGELDRQQQQAIAGRDQQQGWAGDYYEGVNKILAGLGAAQGTANTQSLDAANQRRDATLQAIDDASSAITARAGADQDVRGGGLGQEATAADLARQEAAARDRAQTEGQTAADAAQGYGDAQAAFLRNIQATTAQRGGEIQGQIGASANQTLADLAAQRRQLQTQRGEDLTKNTVDLRQNEVERLLTEKGISSDLAQAQIDANLKAKQIRTSADLARAKMQLQVRLQQMGIDATRAKQMADQQFQAQQNDLNRQSREDIAANHDATTTANTHYRARHSGGGGVFSPKDIKSNKEDRDQAYALATRLKANGISREDALAGLTDKLGDTLARVAVAGIYGGGNERRLDHRLHGRFGIHIPDRYRHAG
ncbi:MAG TPA: hypothetical protein VFT50_09395 [Baekduia sp.]|nr:hypothetical protein [Baekduia sp.]